MDKICKEPTVFSQMITVIREEVADHEVRVKIHCKIIEIVEGESLISSVHFLVGEDPAFDEAYHKVRSK